MRIATFNFENFDDRADEEPSLADRIKVLRPQLQRLEADILCLHEVNAQETGKPHKSGKHRSRSLAALDRLLEDTDYEAFHRVHYHACRRARALGRA